MGMNDMWDTMCHEERRKRCSILDKYSPPKAICSEGRGEEKGKRKRKKEERQRKGKRTSSSLIKK